MGPEETGMIKRIFMAEYSSKVTKTLMDGSLYFYILLIYFFREKGKEGEREEKKY